MSYDNLDPNGIHRDPDSDASESRLMGAVSLTGQKVHNHDGETLGEIREIMVDIETGEIAYAVLSFGGLLGMGDKLFAVPWQALQLDLYGQQIILDMSKRKLQKLPGFDKDRWPDKPNPQFLETGSGSPARRASSALHGIGGINGRQTHSNRSMYTEKEKS